MGLQGRGTETRSFNKVLGAGRVTRGRVGKKGRKTSFCHFSIFTLTSLFATYVMISSNKYKYSLLKNSEFSRVIAFHFYLYTHHFLKQPSDRFPNLKLPFGSYLYILPCIHSINRRTHYIPGPLLGGQKSTARHPPYLGQRGTLPSCEDLCCKHRNSASKLAVT